MIRPRLLLGFYMLLPFLVWAQGPEPVPKTVATHGLPDQVLVDSPTVCFIDFSRRLSLHEAAATRFAVPYQSWIRSILTAPASAAFWTRFTVKNISHSQITVYLDPGDMNFVDLYTFDSGRLLQTVRAGNLRRVPPDIPYIAQQSATLPIKLPARQTVVVYVRLEQKTQEYTFSNLQLWGYGALPPAIMEDYRASGNFVLFQILFIGFLLSQLLYTIFQCSLLRKKEYAYYFFYLLTVALYFLSKYESIYSVNLLFTRWPVLRVYLGKTLLALPYFFYFRFVRSFLDIPLHYKKLNTWIIYTECFLLVYLAADFLWILFTFNQRVQTAAFTVVLLMVFSLAAAFIFYLLQKKQALLYFVLTGSLCVAVGNIVGMLLTFLQDNWNIDLGVSNKIIFAQVGILLEVACFTLGLGYKTRRTEREKLESQQKLISQLKANELLQQKMQHIRNNIAQDLHDEVGSTLSSISILSDIALRETSGAQSGDMIAEIKNSSIALMEKMDDIVWSISPRNDSFESLMLHLRQFAVKLFESKNINYEFNIDKDVFALVQPVEYRQHIYLILKEAVNNLVKYSSATKASVSIKRATNALVMQVKDNGTGFQMSALKRGNGLQNMKNRACLINADFEISSAPGAGTEVTLTVKVI